MSLWQLCQGEKYRGTLDIDPWRVVEAQHISSSRDLVDTREEHDLLEELLERSKPSIENGKHYLIFTPFRYPPLKYGSRFGRQHEMSLWYGSRDLNTAFSEVAYYRLKFFADTAANLEYIEIPMTAFKAHIKTANGINLTQYPFNAHHQQISHKDSYEYSQALGSEMRQAAIEAFVFISARSKELGENIAAFTPEVFIKKNNNYVSTMQSWRCMANKNSIEFTKFLTTERHSFTHDDFK